MRTGFLRQIELAQELRQLRAIEKIQRCPIQTSEREWTAVKGQRIQSRSYCRAYHPSRKSTAS
jgi:hypothetical protein